MKTKLIQRLRNIWKLGEEKEEPFTVTPVNNSTSWDYNATKPHAQIIRRQTLEDEVNKILEE